MLKYGLQLTTLLYIVLPVWSLLTETVVMLSHTLLHIISYHRCYKLSRREETETIDQYRMTDIQCARFNKQMKKYCLQNDNLKC